MTGGGFAGRRGRSATRALRLALIALIALAGLLAPSEGPGAALAAPDGCPGERTAPSFHADAPLVLTYLYYWYEPEERDDPALALHPPADGAFDWRDRDWYQRQLRDMAEAGVDVALAVYWGDGPTWSAHGLESMVEAREELLARGAKAPALGLFVDFNLYSLLMAEDPGVADLTGDPGIDALVEQIAAFYDRVPACHRALVDGRPLIFLWRPDTEDGGRLRFDGETLKTLYRRVEERLGARPYFVRERTWDGYAREAETPIELETDAVFGWGAGLQGPLFDAGTVAVGPGYDDRALAWREGYVREREDGRTYAKDLRTAVASGTPWLLLETWNELWEATAIAETLEHGREYIDLTRRYVDLFRQLARERARDGWFDLGSEQGAYLVRLAEAPQERGRQERADGRLGARPMGEEDGTAYFHFALRPRLSGGGPEPLMVMVEYFDEGAGSFRLEYESDDPDGPGDGAYTPTPSVSLEGTRRWRWHTFSLPDANLRRRQYSGYGDFRLQDWPLEGEPSHLFGRVIVSRAPEVARPVTLGPGGLTLLGKNEGPTELRWHGFQRATGYLVELEHVGTRDLLRTWCDAGTGEWSAGEAPCRMDRAGGIPEQRWQMSWPTTKPGLYRWRVRATDPVGAPIGEASDWGLFLVGE